MELIPSFEVLREYVSRGLVSEVRQGSLSIFNYTKATNYSGAWDEVTTVCRGLVLREETGEVVALPFMKFFNHNEEHATIPSGAPLVTVKLDGSLGISYRDDSGVLRWATRGTFFSPHAQAAEVLWNKQHAGVRVPEEWTLLTEIIHPVNESICHYDFEGLVLLGIRNRMTGEDLPFHVVHDWGRENGLLVTEQVSGDLHSLVERAKELNSNHEGFVLRWDDDRVKVKGAAYIEADRILSGFSNRRVADMWYFDDRSQLDQLPEECRKRFEQLWTDLNNQHNEVTQRAVSVRRRLRAEVSDKKSYVQRARAEHNDIFGVLMSMFDDEDRGVEKLRMWVFKSHYPKFKPRTVEEMDRDRRREQSLAHS